MGRVVITSAARTACGAFLGGLKTVPVEDLAAIAIKEAVKRSNIDPKDVESVILGHVISSTDATNMARSAALLSGCEDATGLTVNRICGSGLQALVNAYQEIMTGGAEIVVAGGAEALSRAPYYLPLNARYEGFRNNSQKLKCSNEQSHFNAAPNSMYPAVWMGNTAENVVDRYKISREDQDIFAFQSQMKAKAAMESGRMAKEIVPVEIKTRKGSTFVDTDEHPRPNVTMEALAKMQPAFQKGGTVTAGNATSLNDGAAAMVVMTEEKAKSLGLKPLAYFVDYGIAALDPMVMGLGPVYSIRKLLQKTNMKLDQMDLIEINEAFAGQVLGCLKELDMYIGTPMYNKLNVNGGAIAFGHPLGCSGARLLGTLAYELIERQGKFGIASACIGGGMGAAVMLERA